MTLPELLALKAGDKVHQTTWRPHKCTEYTVQSFRDYDGHRFVFASNGAGLKRNPVITAISAAGYHVAAQCSRDDEQMAAVADESTL